jgi:hypothetical protein
LKVQRGQQVNEGVFAAVALTVGVTRFKQTLD